MHVDKSFDPYRTLYIVAALTIIIAGMRVSNDILVPMLLAVFIAIICSYPINRMRIRGIPKNVSIFIILVTAFMSILLLTFIVGTSLAEFSENMPLFKQKLKEILFLMSKKLEHFGVKFDYTHWRNYLDVGAALHFTESVLAGLRTALANTFLIALTVIFILLELPVVDVKGKEENKPNYIKIIHKIQQYFGIKTMTSLLTGAVISLWLFIIGVDYPVLWGLTAFLLNFIPNIGSIIAAVPAVLLALIVNGSFTAMLAAAAYLTVNTVVGNVVEPRVMGRGLDLSMLLVFVSLVFWGWVLGPIGMLLAVPLTMTLKILLNHYQSST